MSAIGVRKRKESGCAGVMSSHVAKPANPAPSFCMSAIAAAGNELRALRAKKIGIGNHEVANAARFRELCEILGHAVCPQRLRFIFLTQLKKERPKSRPNHSLPVSTTCRLAAPVPLPRLRSSARRGLQARDCECVVAGGACDRLHFERHDFEIVGKAATGADRVQPLWKAPGPAS